MNPAAQMAFSAGVLAAVLSLPLEAKTLTIGIDLSGSNPLLSEPAFAAGAANYVQAQILALQPGDVVNVRSFGARDNPQNLLNQQIIVSRRHRVQSIARGVAEYLRALPERADTGQSSTNLVGWLELSHGFECAQGGQITVITDGLESSTYVDAQHLLTGKAGLPQAEVDLSGCALSFYGLGAGWPPPQVKRVKQAWQRWSEQAGVSFTPIMP